MIKTTTHILIERLEAGESIICNKCKKGIIIYEMPKVMFFQKFIAIIPNVEHVLYLIEMQLSIRYLKLITTPTVKVGGIK